MIVITVFYLVMSLMKDSWVRNQKESCHYDNFPSNLQGIIKQFLWVNSIKIVGHIINTKFDKHTKNILAHLCLWRTFQIIFSDDSPLDQLIELEFIFVSHERDEYYQFGLKEFCFYKILVRKLRFNQN